MRGRGKGGGEEGGDKGGKGGKGKEEEQEGGEGWTECSVEGETRVADGGQGQFAI